MKKIFTLLTAVLFVFANDPWNGADYHKNSEEQKAAAKKTLSSLTFAGDERVLDIGCGDGYLTFLVAGQLPNGSVVGLDLSPSMVAFAKRTYPDLEFRALDARLLDYENEFDLITSFTTLHWIPEQLTVLKGIEKALCEGGKVVIDIPSSLPKPMLQAVEEKMASKEWNDFFVDFSPGWKFFSVDEYEALLEEANLEPEKLLQIPVAHTFPSKQAFMGFLKQWFPYLRPLPEDKKGRFLEQVVDRYLELQLPQEAGRPWFNVTRLRIEALKP